MNPGEVMKKVEPLEIEEEESEALVKGENNDPHDQHQQHSQSHLSGKVVPGLGIIALLGFSILAILFFGSDNARDKANTNTNMDMDTDTDLVEDDQGTKQKFFIHEVPVLTSELVYNSSNLTQISPQAEEYASNNKWNEALSEIWLHNGFKRHVDRTENPLEAQVFLVPAYVYMSSAMGEIDGMDSGKRLEHFMVRLGKSINSSVKMFMQHQNAPANETVDTWIQKHDMPHVLLTPATNGPMARSLGIHTLAQFLKDKVGQENVYIVSFERNGGWGGGVDLPNIIVAPYVVKPHLSPQELPTAFTNHTRKENFVFYIADSRPHAVEWAGCNRSMVTPLEDEPNMKISVRQKVPQTEFQQYMLQSDFCLVTCGDTPTSRRLTDSMIMGCIPIFIGTRIFGECDPPCFPGWGWTYTHGLYHLPYEETIPWKKFPIVDEAAFVESPKEELYKVFENYTSAKKEELRAIMQQNQLSFVFGWGSPLSSSEFGNAIPALWKSITNILYVQHNTSTWLN